MTSIKPASDGEYEWPRVTAVHPDLGAVQFDVHAIRGRDTGEVLLFAIKNMRSDKQAALIRSGCGQMGDELYPLTEADLPEELLLDIADWCVARPDTKVLMINGAKWGIGDTP
jgi:hypothetical protein